MKTGIERSYELGEEIFPFPDGRITTAITAYGAYKGLNELRIKGLGVAMVGVYPENILHPSIVEYEAAAKARSFVLMIYVNGTSYLSDTFMGRYHNTWFVEGTSQVVDHSVLRTDDLVTVRFKVFPGMVRELG